MKIPFQWKKVEQRIAINILKFGGGSVSSFQNRYNAMVQWYTSRWLEEYHWEDVKLVRELFLY